MNGLYEVQLKYLINLSVINTNNFIGVNGNFFSRDHPDWKKFFALKDC